MVEYRGIMVSNNKAKKDISEVCFWGIALVRNGFVRIKPTSDPSSSESNRVFCEQVLATSKAFMDYFDPSA